MQFQVETDNHIQGRQELQQRVEASVLESLGHLGNSVTRIIAHLSEPSASRSSSGAPDFKCLLEAHVTGLKDLAVSHHAPNLAQAIDGAAERTGCPDASVDAVISVNNVMLWDRPAGFREVLRVLRPGGRLVLTVHRHVLDFPPERLLADATAAGFTGLRLTRRPRRLNSDAVQLLARRPS